mgnify:CR=1 FL=1
MLSNKKIGQNIESLVNDTRKPKSNEVEGNNLFHRPWGNYKVIDESNDYKIKEIVVLPGEKLSLQSHKHRNEHWIWIEGSMKVTKGSDRFDLEKDQSVYIPVGEIHRMENVSGKLAKIIEVQTGQYFGEDDITRYEDIYGRDV